MKQSRLYRPACRISITALALYFVLCTLSASYDACGMNLPAKQEAQEVINEMDCVSMGMIGDAQPKDQKQCCIDFSCPKCFFSHLATAQLEAISAPAEHADLVRGDVHSVATHYNGGIYRPPKSV